MNTQPHLLREPGGLSGAHPCGEAPRGSGRVVSGAQSCRVLRQDEASYSVIVAGGGRTLHRDCGGLTGGLVAVTHSRLRAWLESKHRPTHCPGDYLGRLAVVRILLLVVLKKRKFVLFNDTSRAH